MVNFIIPLKPKFKSKNWDLDIFFLNQTIGSITNQTNDNYKAYIISNEAVEIIKHPKIKNIIVPFEYSDFSEIDCSEMDGNIDEKWIVNAFDQGRKALYGAKIAINEGGGVCNVIRC